MSKKIRTIICDIETERLINPEKLWVIGVKDVDTGESRAFVRPDLYPEDFLEYMVDVKHIVGHNFIDFDLPNLVRLVKGFKFNPRNVIDTLVISRLLHFKRRSGHSLAAWGEYLGEAKGDFTDFSVFSEAMIKYCLQDIEVNYKLYKFFKPYLDKERWKKSVRLELDSAIICQQMHDVGFFFNKKEGDTLYKEIVTKLQELGNEIREAFPPNIKILREFQVKITKSGETSKVGWKRLGAPGIMYRWSNTKAEISKIPEDFAIPEEGDLPLVEICEVQEFNPGSTKMCIEALYNCGWNPTDKTKGHLKAEREKDKEKLERFKVYGWKINEENLKTLPESAPEAAQKLVQWILLDSRRSTLEEWFNAYNPSTGRVHGTINSLGTWTHRKSHVRPNMGNVPSLYHLPTDREPSATDLLKEEYNGRLRALFCVPEGRALVGTDADGIQLRILAHLMEDKKFTEALVNGDKDKGTDAHSLNASFLSATRDTAKTFIYAWLLGAGAKKQAEILHCSVAAAKNKEKNFISSYPGLKRIKEELVPADARRGYFEGIDGRYVVCNSEHLMLAGYLQNGESVIMKTANIIWRTELKAMGIPFWQVNDVHDEWQTECLEVDAETVGKVQANSIRKAGELYGLNCPLAGTYDIGKNWRDTH